MNRKAIIFGIKGYSLTNKEKKLFKKSKGKLKLLNIGEISSPINIEISHASKKAIQIVEKLGGKVTLINK